MFLNLNCVIVNIIAIGGLYDRKFQGPWNQSRYAQAGPDTYVNKNKLWIIQGSKYIIKAKYKFLILKIK